MRRYLILAAAAAPLLLAAPADAASRGSWCAGQTIGGDSWSENCSFRSFHACRNEVIAGNRGQCFRNPYRSARGMRGYHRGYARGWR
jgi:hypothetical protein